MDEIKARANKALKNYLHPKHVDELEPRFPLARRLAPTLPKRCTYCSEWMPAGSLDRGRCLACGIPIGD